VTYEQWQRHRACERKQRLDSELVANNWATLLGWKYGKRHEAYACRWCDGWHVATIKIRRAA
jgi:hypothetical protein